MKLKSFAHSPARLVILGLVCASALVNTLTHAQSGGPFDLTWSTIDGGGGFSSGAQFQLSGTIGQADAGALTGGNFKLEGGFWSGLTLIQTDGSLLLKIKLTDAGMAILSWPLSLAGFTLEETANLAQPNSWNAVPQAIVNTTTEHTITVPAAGIIKCYRLRKP